MERTSMTAVYGGVFDPPTNGHLHIIQKALNLFGRVVVVLATNPSKTPMFSDEKRINMLKSMTKHMENISVEILPENEYLVSFAKKWKNTCLIRGIRDNIDFPYEQNICRTNKVICKSIETVYLMPDDAYSLVSSSWVKGLVGKNGWRDVIGNYVSESVLDTLKEKFLGNFFREMMLKNHTVSDGSKEQIEKLVEFIVKSYKGRAYHNIDHIIDGIEILAQHNADFNTLYAWIFHDISPSEEESARLACESYLLPQQQAEEIIKLILATKHLTCNYETEKEKLIVSADLIILASERFKYLLYSEKIFEECLKKEEDRHSEVFLENFKNERVKFLEKMLLRKFIFPHSSFFDYEKVARHNIRREIETLKEQKWAIENTF